MGDKTFYGLIGACLVALVVSAIVFWPSPGTPLQPEAKPAALALAQQGKSLF
jgi:hypothetical protein